MNDKKKPTERVRESDFRRLSIKAAKHGVGEYSWSDSTARAHYETVMGIWEERDAQRKTGGDKSSESRKEDRAARLDKLSEALNRLRARFLMKERFKLDEIWVEAGFKEDERVGRFTFDQIARHADELCAKSGPR